MNHPPLNFQCTLRNKNEKIMIMNALFLIMVSSDMIFFADFCHFFGLRMAGIKTAATMIANPIRRREGVINIGIGVM